MDLDIFDALFFCTLEPSNNIYMKIWMMVVN